MLAFVFGASLLLAPVLEHVSTPPHATKHNGSPSAPQVPLPQSLVATACLAHNLRLLHEDPAYQPFEQHLELATPGLVVEVW